MKEYYIKNTPEDTFKKEEDEFSPVFFIQVNGKLNSILKKYNFLTEDQKENKRKKLFEELYEKLFMIIKRKAYCTINVQSYPFYTFIEALSNIIDEEVFYIEQDGIYIRTMDSLRICLILTEIKVRGFKFYSNGGVAFNIEDLAKTLKCKKGDRAMTEIIFSQDKVFVKIDSKKYNSIIERSLSAIDLEKAEVPIEMLFKINYPCTFALSREKLEYLLRNLDCGNIKIISSQNKIEFSDTIHKSKGKVIWKKEKLDQLKCNFSILEKEFSEKNLPVKKRKNIQKILETKKCDSVFSSNYLKFISEMTKVIEMKNLISFSIRNDNPLKAELKFKSLNNTNMIFFIAPRVEEIEIEIEE